MPVWNGNRMVADSVVDDAEFDPVRYQVPVWVTYPGFPNSRFRFDLTIWAHSVADACCEVEAIYRDKELRRERFNVDGDLLADSFSINVAGIERVGRGR